MEVGCVARNQISVFNPVVLNDTSLLIISVVVSYNRGTYKGQTCQTSLLTMNSRQPCVHIQPGVQGQ